MSSSVWGTGAHGRASFAVMIGEPFGPASPEIDFVAAPAPLTTGWHHLAGVRDTAAGRFELYVDGVLVASKTPGVIGVIDSQVATVLGGVNPIFGQELLDGKIDEAQIYDRGLTGAEIESIFNAGSAGLCHCSTEPADIISWWPGDFDVNAPDIRGGNAGTLVGGVSSAVGIVGNAFDLDGTAGTGITVSNHASLNPTSEITIAAWVRPDSFPNEFPAVIRKPGNYILSVSVNAQAACQIGQFASIEGGSVPIGTWCGVHLRRRHGEAVRQRRAGR
jgi:hypothetical protein